MANKPPIQPLAEGQTAEPGVSDDITLLIGKVITGWSNLEASMDDLIWTLLELDEERGKIVTNGLQAQRKLLMIRKLTELRVTDENFLKGLKKALKFADELRDGRNFISHGVWWTIMPDGIPCAASLKVKGEAGEVVSESFSAERLIAIIDGTERLKQNFIEYRERLQRLPTRHEEG